MKTDDAEAIKAATEELTKYLNELSTMLYSQAEQSAPTEGTADSDTVDAEYKVDDEDDPQNN